MKRLLTFEDLTNFYANKYKKTVHFDASKTGEPIVVQTKGTIVFEKTDENEVTAGLTPVRLQSCHTDRNLNSSSISYEVMKNRFLPTFKNRPILGFIHDVDGEPCFYGHNMHIEETDNGEEIVYDEIPVGIIPETNNAELVYDEEAKHYNVFVDGYIFNEYTKAADILEEAKELSVSVELSLNEFSYNPKEKLLVIEDGYFSGVTILQCDDNGKEVKPGMAGSNIKLKDFSESNNSIFSSLTEEENSKIIEMQEKIAELEATLSRFNINTEIRKGGDTLNKELLENLLSKYAKTQEELTFEIEGLSDEELEAAFAKAFEVEEEPTSYEEKKLEDVVEEAVSEEGEPAALSDDVESVSEAQNNEPETEETVEETELDNTDEDGVSDDGDSEDFAKCKKKCEEDSEEDETNEEFKCEKKNEVAEFTKNFTLSMEDIRCGLYNLLFEVEQADNDCYGICQTFDVYFIYQSYCTGKTYKQAYSINGDNVAFEGSRIEVFAEYLTQEEKNQLQSMRANYSLVVDKLSKYEAAELKAEKEAIFADEAYADFIESDGFKTIRDNMDTYSVDELRNACELQFAKEVRANKNFALEKPVKEVKKAPAMFAFAKQEVNNEFLDSLLKTAKNK